MESSHGYCSFGPQEMHFRPQECRLEGSEIRARKMDPWRPPGIPVVLGQAGCSYTGSISEASFERVAPGRSEKKNGDASLEMGFTLCSGWRFDFARPISR